ncbi:hypothetical protein [Leptospira sp. GIMC2001]|uniref:hypothetical protein n=1 Tax=Leptospira sp. GIMC2001 TaxID=1513297 RepID=UPI00234AAA09|nr:hypothetical protein [Leptospira sp. GIMC2001]WCL47618.1 hypothetical protein O4O04_01225 [Leptospira sp. GIMC2001]
MKNGQRSLHSMGIGLKFAILCSLVYSINALRATDLIPEEKLESDEVVVYDTARYTIQWEDGWEVSLPTIGELQSENNEMSFGEILSVDLEKRKATIQLRYFLSGEFYVPVSWKLPDSDAWVESQKTIKVKSSIADGESSTEEDAIAPIEFGKFLWHRLILLTLFFLLILVGLIYAYRHWKNQPLDAIIETRPPIPDDEKWNLKIQKFFKDPEISKKQFAFFLTEYLKWKLSIALESDLSMKSDSELLEVIFNRSSIPQEELREVKWFLLVAKFTPLLETFSQEEAKKFWDRWANLISGIHHV